MHLGKMTEKVVETVLLLRELWRNETTRIRCCVNYGDTEWNIKVNAEKLHNTLINDWNYNVMVAKNSHIKN